MEQEAKWRRKPSDFERLMFQISQTGNLLVAYRLSLSTRRPMQRNDVEQALSQLYRKSPNLRTCLVKSEDGLWFEEMEKETIDFEVSSADVDDVTDYMHSHIYSHDGPLWRARLVPVPTPRYQPHNLSSFHEDLKDTFPHCYHVVFGFNHAIGDGHTSIRICAAFARILDCVLAGEEVDGEQIGSFDLNEEYIQNEQELITRCLTDEKLRENFIRMVKEGEPDSLLFNHVITPSEECERKTVLYSQSLDQPTTTRLQEKCRAKKVTFSSLVAAVGNLTLVDLLVEKGMIQDTYSISNSHLVNLRRGWPKGTTEKAFGCYFSSSPRQFFETPANVNEDQFWEYVKYIHEKFYRLLTDEKFLEMNSCTIWCYMNDRTDYLQRDLTYNTRGDLTKMFEGTKEITVTNLINTTSIHKTDIPWDDVFGTMRGRLTHTIKYNTGMISKATAVKYSDLVYARLLKTAGPWDSPLSM